MRRSVDGRVIVVVRSGVPDSTLVPQIEVSVTLTVALPLPVYRGSCSVDNESCGLNETLPCTVSEEEEANVFSNDATRSHFVNKPKIVRQSDLADKSR